MGGTTIWERWDSMLPDGSINPGDMTSFNHYALGAVADWMHRTVAGLAPLAPGYRRILVEPRPGGGLTWAQASLETPHGLAAVRWELDGSALRVEVTVPEGAEAVLRLPGRPDESVGPGIHARLTTGGEHSD
jgi:alpha-L-rhamnosidase